MVMPRGDRGQICAAYRIAAGRGVPTNFPLDCVLARIIVKNRLIVIPYVPSCFLHSDQPQLSHTACHKDVSMPWHESATRPRRAPIPSAEVLQATWRTGHLEVNSQGPRPGAPGRRGISRAQLEPLGPAIRPEAILIET